MRVAINATFLGQESTGSGQYLHQLSSHLAPSIGPGELLLLVPAWTESTSLTAVGSHTLPTPFDHLNRDLAKLWFEQVTFPAACVRWGADLAHVPYFAPPLRPTVPTLVTIHDLIPLLLPTYRRSVRARLYFRLVSWAAGQAAFVLADSQSSRQDTITHLQMPPSRVRVIHLAAGERYRPVPEGSARERLRERYHLPRSYLLYLGGFDRRKNVLAIVTAFARMQSGWEPSTRRHEPWLVIAGRLPREDTRLTPDPRRAVRELGVTKGVTFTGWVSEEDKPALYSGARALVFPSHYEGFGLPPLEAMACGTPVIGSDRASLPEVIGPGGILVSPDDVEGLAEAMASLWRDDRLRQRLSGLALRQAGRFSWSRAAEETMVAYREVVAFRGGPTRSGGAVAA